MSFNMHTCSALCNFDHITAAGVQVNKHTAVSITDLSVSMMSGYILSATIQTVVRITNIRR